MKKILKLLKKYYKLIIIILTIIIVVLLGLFIYKNLFEQNVSQRLEGVENHKVTKKEISSVKEHFLEVEDIDKIDIETNYKIIKIFLKLNKNIDFDVVKEISNEAVMSFSEENLKFYDIEIFVECSEESDIYPKIGYRFKTNSEFIWNR